MEKLPISALVVSRNEGNLLADCLQSISFCDEIMLIDLESNDDTIEVAKKFTHLIISAQKVEMVEHLFPEYIPQLKNEWVMLIDPDERIDPKLELDIRDFFADIPIDCGKINVPIQYYYKNKALKGTVWGGEKTGRLLINQTSCNIGSNVHTAISLKPGFQTYRIKRNISNVDHHFWVQSFAQMLEKHKRYTQKEGKSKYDKGERYTFLRQYKATIFAFTESFFKCKGYKDGFLGLILRGFYAWYIWSSWQSLSVYQEQIAHG
jgi:glycosyltransferase involved in cell wall biosynthesis